MAILKCKMCGGDMNISSDKTFGICEYCGCTMTLPRVADDQRADAFNRGNYFRRIGEFDKALSVYEHIVEEDPNDAEAHWCCALCRFGIEWVEDPVSMEYLPTCHRASFDIFTNDVDYLAAVELTDGITQKQYKKDAARISEVQKGILATSQNEKPFDVFICYKELDENGDRTVDSTLAQDIYYQLNDQGLRVFFARITLEDKVGSEYEPYIFSALNSAKVMIVVGTTPEYFNAVWVKNEWSRFLSIVKHDRSKVILPCYKGMDPYDLPEQLSVLQSYDMSKIGFIQDLVRGINKVVSAANKATADQQPISGNDGGNIDPLLKRAFMFLEDGEFSRADEFCEQVLNQNPECAEAYLGKLMAEVQVRKKPDLKNCEQPFDDKSNYQKSLRFGNANLKRELLSYNQCIEDRNEHERLAKIYRNAKDGLKTAKTEEDCLAIVSTLDGIAEFEEARELATKCREQAEACRKDAIYTSAISTIKTSVDKKAAYLRAIKLFESIAGWTDADEQAAVCREKLEVFQAAEEEARRNAEEKRIAAQKAAKRRKRFFAIATPIVCVCVAFTIVLTTVIIPSFQYRAAIKAINDGNIIEAYKDLIALEGYKDSSEKAAEIFDQFDKEEKLKVAKVGDTLLFGIYEQDNDTSNGKEAIEWLVLAREGNKLLLISNKALEAKVYNSTYEDVTWENCELRTWMNDTFLNTAFSAEEQTKIRSTDVPADKNPNYYNTDPGNATTDKVFLLSIHEVSKYFTNDEARKCLPTIYAKESNKNRVLLSSTSTKDNAATCWWWLRSPGRNQTYTAYIAGSGSVNSDGSFSTGVSGIRPAIWISLSDN